MKTVSELRKSLAKAEAELNRAQQAYSVCLLTSDGDGCIAEQEAQAAAEREVNALRRRIAAAERQTAREMA